MRFERGKDPKDSIEIGRDAPIKKLIREGIRESRREDLEEWETRFKWTMYNKGIEILNVVKIERWPKDYEWKFLYNYMDGEEAHMIKEVTLTAKEIITAYEL